MLFLLVIFILKPSGYPATLVCADEVNVNV